MENLMGDYEKSLQALYDHVGFTEDWVIFPVDDNTEMYWKINGGCVIFHEERENLSDEESWNYYSNEIYTQRFYKKHVYRGEKLTMIFCDTQTDGMKYFSFFDNNKEVVDNEK